MHGRTPSTRRLPIRWCKPGRLYPEERLVGVYQAQLAGNCDFCGAEIPTGALLTKRHDLPQRGLPWVCTACQPLQPPHYVPLALLTADVADLRLFLWALPAETPHRFAYALAVSEEHARALLDEETGQHPAGAPEVFDGPTAGVR